MQHNTCLAPESLYVQLFSVKSQYFLHSACTTHQEYSHEGRPRASFTDSIRCTRSLLWFNLLEIVLIAPLCEFQLGNVVLNMEHSTYRKWRLRHLAAIVTYLTKKYLPTFFWPTSLKMNPFEIVLASVHRYLDIPSIRGNYVVLGINAMPPSTWLEIACGPAPSAS